MTCLSEQTALIEAANASLKSENESLRGKLALTTAEVDRLTADNALMKIKIDEFIHHRARLQTSIINAGNLLIEAMKPNATLDTPKAEAISDQSK